MAYDLVVGISNQVKDSPTIVGGIEFDEYPAICSLLKVKDCFFLNRIANQFEDQSFSVEELNEANEHLLSLLPLEISKNERMLLHKLISVVGYAIHKNESLFGVAD